MNATEVNQKMRERVLKAIKKFAEKLHVLPSQVQLKVCLEQNQDGIPVPVYYVLENYKKKQTATIYQVLCIPKIVVYVDPEQYADIVPGFLIAALWWCVEQHGIDPLKVSLLFNTDGNEVYLHIYDEGKPIKKFVDPTTLFNQEVLMAYAAAAMS